MRVLTTAEKRRVDRRAQEELGLPSLVLMENAARGVAEVLVARYSRAGVVQILCGPGNNGGDGLALARHLQLRGLFPRCLLAASPERLEGDARVQYEACRHAAIDVVAASPAELVRRLGEPPQGGDVLVDALFGTGLSRPLEGEWIDLVEAVNEAAVDVVAIDLPSGLDGDSGVPIGPHVVATVTVALVAPQRAHVLDPAARAVGLLEVADLGIPAALVDSAEPELETLEAESLRPLLPRRARDAHKGTAGHLLLWAGSLGYAGAAALAARAAGRMGAGLVTVATPTDVQPTVASAVLESMTLPLAASDPEALAARIVETASRRTALAAGPGLGRGEEVRQAITRVVAACPVPLVLDADALNAFAGRCEALAGREAAAVLTPHPGELARLLATTAAEVQADRPKAARRAAALAQAVVVLKGRGTLVATPEGRLFLCRLGGPALATGGSGDVLTGMIGALLAQGVAPRESACLAVWLHARCGDRLAAQLGELSVIAGDLIEALPEAIEELR